MSANAQGKKEQLRQPASPSLGQQPEAGDDLDERQRLSQTDNASRAQADRGDQPGQPQKRGPSPRQDDNGTGQNRLNEAD